MTNAEGQALRELVAASLNEAERVWNQARPLMEKSAVRMDSAWNMQTTIPGYETIIDGKPEVDTFICMAIDMRDSSGHLMQAISAKIAKVSQLERIFYETSALLPAAAEIIGNHGGRVTEYLGDGALGMFLARGEGEDRNEIVRTVHRAASSYLNCVNEIINPELDRRYRLPPLSVGIGLAFSRAVITAVGLQGNRLPKVVGECVYRATKLCKGDNEIVVDERLRNIWPSKKGGKLRFVPKAFKGSAGIQHDGFVVKRGVE